MKSEFKEVIILNLECSSKGDKRFSALYAKVTFNNVYDSIENHYQSVKRKHDNQIVKKGEKPDYIVINNIKLPTKFLTPFYKYLWYIYLNQHTELVKYASSFDSFSDMFKGKNTVNSQADVIEEYIKNRRMMIKDIMVIFPYLKQGR